MTTSGAVDEPRIVDIGSGVYLIDTAMAGYSSIVASYFLAASKPCLVETGSALSSGTVQRALARWGVAAGDLATIVVTHIHLDHAGGVGDLAAAYPNAQVVVHQRGARHLADPERLLVSARRVYGELFDTVFGDLRPTDAARLRAVEDVDVVDLGDGRTLTSYYTPGHAQHHVGLVDSATGDVYVGDAAGVYIPDLDVLRPSTPPPDFDLPTALASLRRLAALDPARLLFSHFGPVSAPGEVLARAGEEIRAWVDLIGHARSETPDLDHAVAMVQARTRERYPRLYADANLAQKHETLSSTEANVVGISRWLDREHVS